MSESVNFDSQGGYRFGDPLKEMDVKAGGSGQTQQRQSHVSMHLPPQTGGTSGPVAPRPTFNLDALRRQTKVEQPVAKEEPAVEKAAAAPAEKLRVVEKPVEEPKVDAHTVEEKKVGEQPSDGLPSVDEVLAPYLEQAAGEAAAQEAYAELVEQQAAPAEVEVDNALADTQTKASPRFNLNQLGLTARETGADEESVSEVTPAENVGQVRRMDLQQGEKPKPEAAEDTYKEPVAPAGETPVEPVAESPAEAAAMQAEQEAMNYTDETPFEVVPLQTIIQMLYATDRVISDWLGRVCKEYTKRPTTIFSCGSHPNLRAYSMIYPLKPKGNTVYITMGVGKKITTCAFDGKRKTFSDASSQISVSGTCAFVQDAPVASCAQRERTAVRL